MTELSDTLIWAAIIAIAIGTYALRSVFLLGIQYFDGMPAPIERTLPLVPVAVFAALIAPELAYLDGELVISHQNERLIAGIAAFIAAWVSENLLLTVIVGLGLLWILNLV